jgi:hypothetical protein
MPKVPKLAWQVEFPKYKKLPCEGNSHSTKFAGRVEFPKYKNVSVLTLCTGELLRLSLVSPDLPLAGHGVLQPGSLPPEVVFFYYRKLMATGSLFPGTDSSGGTDSSQESIPPV